MPLNPVTKQPEPIRIKLPYGQRGVQALAFSRSGKQELLVTVSTDNAHTVNVWAWKERDPAGNVKLIACKSSNAGTPPQVFCCVMRPEPEFFSETAVARAEAKAYDATHAPALYLRRDHSPAGETPAHFADFITAGVNHIKFWVLDRRPTTPADVRLTDYQGNFTQVKPFLTVTQQDVLHVAYLPSGFVAAGGTNGSITLYNDRQAVREIAAHASFCRCFSYGL